MSKIYRVRITPFLGSWILSHGMRLALSQLPCPPWPDTRVLVICHLPGVDDLLLGWLPVYAYVQRILNRIA